MTDRSTRNQLARCPAARRTVVLVVALLCGRSLAADPLQYIPADVAGVAVFRDLQEAAKKLNPFLKKINPDHHGLDLEELGQGLKLSDGEWDPSSPVVIVLTRPEFSGESMIVAFRPAKGSALLDPAPRSPKRIKKHEGPNGEFFTVVRDNVAFVGRSLRSLRVIQPRPENRSFRGRLDESEKELLAKSDAFVRVDLDRWRDKMTPFVVLGLGMMKLKAAAESSHSTDTTAVVDWMADAVRSFIDQMDSVSLAFSFDGETLRLDHYHRFAAGRSVAQYLAKVRTCKDDLLAMAPNRPFLMFATANWNCPDGECLTVSLSRHILGMESVSKRMSEDTRCRLTKELGGCYGQIRGSTFMVLTEPGRVLPLELVGGYAVDDSSAAIKQLCFVQENANEAMSALLPSSHCTGKFKPRHGQGIDFMELNFTPDDLPEKVRTELSNIYGEKVRYQQAVAGPNRVVYVFAEPPTHVVEMVRAKPDQRVDKNPAVARLLSRLPKQPHVLVVLDLEQSLAAVPYLAALEDDDGTALSTPMQTESCGTSSKAGLIGWAGVFRPTSINGQFAMDAQDAIETFRLAREMPQKLTKSSGVQRKTILTEHP